MSTRTIDRSKRVAPGGNIDTKNIIPGGKTRSGRRKSKSPRRKTSKSPSRNTTSKSTGKGRGRPKKITNENTKENKIEVVVTDKEEIVEDRMDEEEVEQKVEEKVVQKVEEMKITEKKEETKKSTPTRKRNSLNKKQEKVQEKVDIIALVGKISGSASAMKEARNYRESNELIPTAIQAFCDAWGEDGSKNLASEAFNLPEIKFGQEFALEEEEYEEIAFLKKTPSAILIGDGTKLIVADMNDKDQDFKVWLVADDNEEKVVGPMKMSEFLKDLKVQEIEEEEEDN